MQTFVFPHKVAVIIIIIIAILQLDVFGHTITSSLFLVNAKFYEFYHVFSSTCEMSWGKKNLLAFSFFISLKNFSCVQRH